MLWAPRVTVAAVAERANRFLMVKESVGGRLVYNQPAGHLEKGESLIEAAIRETHEETGWWFEPENIVGVYRWNEPQRDVTFIRVTFAGSCTERDGDAALDADIVETLWLDHAELGRYSGELRSPLVMRSIEDYLQGRRYPLDLLTDIV